MAFNDFTTHDDDDAQDPNISGPSTNNGTTPSATTLPPGAIASTINQMMGRQQLVVNDDEIPPELDNFNARYANADPILFRDEIVDQTMAVLIGKDKPNAMLIGHAGTGKTKIAEDIARRLACNDPSVPDQLKGYTVYELPLCSLVAGGGIVGEIEQRLKTIIAWASCKSNKAILFIDEIHMLTDDNSSTYTKIAQQLKPALSRGRIRVIGATTVNESMSIADDPALNRRFSRIIVDELTREQTVEILEKYWPSLAAHYDFQIDMAPEVISSCVDIADRFSFQGAHRPDSAVTLIDRACADEIVAQKRRLALAKQSNNQALIQAIQAQPKAVVTERTLKRTAQRLMTGHAAKHDIDANVMADAFAPIQGQTRAVDIVSRHILRRERNLFPSNKPLALMFAGPTGVGKTMMAKIIGEVVCQCEPIILNMTEYNSPASVTRITGASAGYIGYDSKAELPFDPLQTNPYQVILLDEFEKADPSVQRLFMRALDEGKLRTANGKDIDFSRSIIIATTNAGNAKKKVAHLGFCPETERTSFDPNMLANDFDMEFLNRFTEIIEFEPMPKETFRSILASTYKTEAARINAEFSRINLPAELDDDTLDALTKENYVPEFGARPTHRTIKAWIEDNA